MLLSQNLVRRSSIASGAIALMVIAFAGLASVARAEDAGLPARAHDLIQRRCFACHGSEQKGKLDLRTRQGLLAGGASGAAAKPGDARSLLIQRVTAEGAARMPPDGSLTPEEIETLRQWIAGGAVYPSGAADSAGHWSFSPPVRKTPPLIVDPLFRAAVRSPVDNFVFKKLEAEGLDPSPEADRYTLIRRLSFDVTGLPPTQAEIARFVTDRSPRAYEDLVDRLLASPHYGERWAQHWLDTVRFAETNGFELDGDRPQAWRYRDYVVDALNADLPYDRFITEQIAGDLLAPDDFKMRVAVGFLRAGPQHVVGGNQDAAVNRQEWLTEAVSGLGNSVMGLTIQCARCHDHKFDPIPQRDYYALEAFLAATADEEFKSVPAGVVEAHSRATAAHSALLQPIKNALAAIEKPYRERLRAEKLNRLEAPFAQALAAPAEKRTPEQKRLAGEAMNLIKVSWDEVVAVLPPDIAARRKALRREMHEIELRAPEPLPFAPSVSDRLQPTPATHLLIRGEAHAKGEEVKPAFPSALRLPALPPTAAGEPRRIALARWLTRPDHPLTARVAVNRIWQHYLGRGLVGTPNDFGANGERPSHPELLDWLATELVRQEWSLKSIHRTILLSRTYRQQSQSTASGESADPSNRLFWRQNRRRLDAEAVRDAYLAAAGLLNREMGGPSIRIPIEPEVYETIFTEGEPDNLWPVHPNPRQHVRRSLYLLRKRNVRLPLMAVFDAPDMMSSCAARGQSVHALQALTLLNSPLAQQSAEALAARVRQEAQSDGQRIRRMFLHCAGRPPLPAEERAALDFVRQSTAADGAAAAWTDLALGVLNLNDTIYLR